MITAQFSLACSKCHSSCLLWMMCVVQVLCDLIAVINTMNYTILLAKLLTLRSVKARVLAWFKSIYLTKTVCWYSVC